jgi:hypothetical protein
MTEQNTTEGLENLNDNSSWGGKRVGAGRPAGSKDPETIEREKVIEAMKQRIAKSAEQLLNSQMNLAQGVQMLYCITTNEKGIRSKPELVTCQATIEEYLAGELEDKDKEYYFITTERPDNKALDSLFDRAFGKAQNNVDVTSGGKPIPIYGGATVSIQRHVSDAEDIQPTKEN